MSAHVLSISSGQMSDDAGAEYKCFALKVLQLTSKTTLICFIKTIVVTIANSNEGSLWERLWSYFQQEIQNLLQ